MEPAVIVALVGVFCLPTPRDELGDALNFA